MPESQKEKRQRLFLNAVNSLQLENPNAEIADKIGYNRGNMSRILNGQIAPSTTVVQNFEKAFGIDVEDFDFFDQKETPPKETRFEVLIADKVMEGLAPYLTDFQAGHKIVNEQLRDMTELLHELAAQVIELRTELEQIKSTCGNTDAAIMKVQKNLLDVHQVIVEQE